jgi:hypothetical protein
MAGKAKYADQMSKHLGTQVDGACGIAKPGSTMTGALTVGVGGAVGAAAAAAAGSRGGPAPAGDIAVTRNSILALEPDCFDLVGIDALLGRPKGEPYAKVPYADVAEVALSEGKITTRVDVALTDGRTFAFESKRLGANKPNREVLELLRQRGGG